MIQNKKPTKDISKDDIENKLFKVCNKRTKRSVKVNNRITFGNGDINIIAGPNGVETRKLIHKTASFLNSIGVKILRGHVFKPLTFPYRSNQYSESGIKGLEWLKEVKSEYNMTIVSEITEMQYFDKMLKTVDIFQIGTRNMQNFELVREVARSKKPIILKRHFGSSLRDLLGVAEHILYEGNYNLILCERGISAPHTHRETSRYLLDIQAIPALKELTNFPIIADPSHASFWAPWVPSLAYASVAAGVDGLIIETHPNPSKSKVDPLQPLNFNVFKKVFKNIKSVHKLTKKF